MYLYDKWGYLMTTKHDLVITALQQRIGELVSGYETQVAILRAELTEAMNLANFNKDQDME
jgi:hypothetical protein